MEIVKPRISLSRIKEAPSLIDPVFLNTPQYLSESLSAYLKADIFLKDETRNPVGSFKGRGTELLVAGIQESTEIICASAGNFGQAMAYSCGKKHISLTVFASTAANTFKVERMRSLGAKVILQGHDFDEAKSAAKDFAHASGARFVEDSLDIETVEGAGTIGLELGDLAAALPHALDYLLISLGNGAMFNGIASVFKELSPATKLIAVQAAGAPAMIHSWQKGALVSYPTVNTIADGIAVRLPVPQALTDMQGLADEGILVEEANIIKGMKLLHQHAGLTVEPSAAVGLAAILENQERFRHHSVGLVICGANLTAAQKDEWL